MFNKQTVFEKTTFDTLVSENTEVKGDITSKGVIRIDGKVTGSINVQGDLFIGGTALIKGDITASNIHIAGNVEGNIFSSGVLKLLVTSKLTGDIQVKSFVCEEGSLFEGTCRMADSSKSLLMSQKKEYKKSEAINEPEAG